MTPARLLELRSIVREYLEWCDRDSEEDPAAYQKAASNYDNEVVYKPVSTVLAMLDEIDRLRAAASTWKAYAKAERQARIRYQEMAADVPISVRTTEGLAGLAQRESAG